MHSRWRSWVFSLFALLLPLCSRAGGSGLNVLVVVNQNSTNSVQLGNYYREKRQIPPQNVLRINWTGGIVSWTTNDFTTYLVNPLLAALSGRQLTNQIDYLVLSMDIPYAVTSSDGTTDSTTSSLFYGFQTNGAPVAGVPSCSLPDASSNSYAGSEFIFRAIAPGNLSYSNVLATMITASNLNLAKLIVDQGLSGDSTFPTQTVFLAKTTDPARNVRYQTFDDAIFNTRLRGNYSMQRTNVYSISGFGTILGFATGVYNFTVSDVWFVPGGMADDLTSYGGTIFQDSGQLNILSFLAAGASGTYGTVVEPCNYLEKFPSSQNYFYQARGFSLAECYYQSITNPFEGLVLGEPLSAPFSKPGAGSWLSLPTNSLLSGTTNLSVQFMAADASHPLQQLDLFLDGTWLRTITNAGPAAGNLLTVTINGRIMNYSVPPNATVKSVAAGLTAVLNNVANSNATKVFAYTHGDRIELQSVDRTKTGAQVSLSVNNSVGTTNVLTAFVGASRTNFLDTTANGIRSFLIQGDPVNGSWLQLVATRTNGTIATIAVTNNASLTLAQLTQSLLDKINTNTSPSLQGLDGMAGEDLLDYGTSPQVVQFNLRARGVGWDAAQIQADLNASAGLSLSSGGPVKLDENVNDLTPRNHLYVMDGLTNLPATFSFNTTTQADGYHELIAVAYEGTHVRTQTRAQQQVRIQNNPWSATLTTLVGGSNTAVEATLQFSVVATTGAISKIELFSTGGSLSNVLNQSTAIFSVAGTNLGIGLHPFYAIVTANDGKQYRTDTKWIRLIGPDSPFVVSVTAPPPRLTWPATAGRSYDILSTTNLTNAFQVRDTVTPTNSLGQWTETNTTARARYYRVRTAQ